MKTHLDERMNERMDEWIGVHMTMDEQAQIDKFKKEYLMKYRDMLINNPRDRGRG